MSKHEPTRRKQAEPPIVKCLRCFRSFTSKYAYKNHMCQERHASRQIQIECCSSPQ